MTTCMLPTCEDCMWHLLNCDLNWWDIEHSYSCQYHPQPPGVSSFVESEVADVSDLCRDLHAVELAADKLLPYILKSNLHLVFASFLNEKKLVHRLLSFFQNPTLDLESNPHSILIRIWFFSLWNFKTGAD
jgi:hypothetical protein